MTVNVRVRRETPPPGAVRASGPAPAISPRTLDVAVGLGVVAVRVAKAPIMLALNPLRRVAGSRVGAPLVGRSTDRLAASGREARDWALGQVEVTAGEVLRGPLPEVTVRSLIEHHVGERVVGELDRVGATDATIGAVQQEVTERVLASPAFQQTLAQVVEAVVASPGVHAVLKEQTRTMGGDFLDAARRRAAGLDAATERAAARLLHRTPRPPGPYAGIVSRATAFGLDAFVVAAAFVGVAAVGGLVWALSAPLRRGWLTDVLLGTALTVASSAYFVIGWVTLGATLGMWFVSMRVVAPGGGPPGLVRALVRFAGFVVSIAFFFLGFLPIVVDGRRRGLADLIAGTTVEWVPEHPLPAEDVL